MIFAADFILSLILISAGYVYACYYLNSKNWNNGDVSVLKLSRNKVVYLVFAVIAVTCVAASFESIYKLSLWQNIKLLTLILILFPIAAIDLRLQKIPNQLIVVALILRALIYIPEFILSVSNAFRTLKSDLAGAVIITVFFLFMLLLLKNSIGMGDIKLFGVIGFYQGLWGAINSVFFSLLVSFVLSIFLLISRKKGRTDSISFAPCILLGTTIAMCVSGM